MIIDSSDNVHNANRIDISCYRRATFKYEIDCSSLLDILEDLEFTFLESGYLAVMEIKSRFNAAENASPLLTFSGSDIEYTEQGIEYDDENIPIELRTMTKTPPMITMSKLEITLPAGEYFYDIFFVNSASRIAFHYGTFTVIQNITEFNIEDLLNPPVQ